MKKLSRILFLLCLVTVLVCLACTVASAAQTDTVIQRVELLFPEPELGEDPHDYQKRITCPEGSNYSIAVVGVGTGNGNWSVGFAYGTSFSYQVEIKANAGYTFSDAPIYANDTLTNWTARGSSAFCSWDVVMGEPLEAVELPAWPTELYAGQTAGEGTLPLPEDSKVQVAYKWTAYSHAYLYTQSIPVLEDGHIYTLHYNVTPKDGYYFDQNTRITVGGEEIDCSIRTFQFTISKDIMLNVTVVDQIDIQYTRPRDGDLRADFTVTVTPGDWTCSHEIRAASVSADKKESFEAGIAYTLGLNLRANTGYAFAEQVTVTFNGEDPQIGITRFMTSLILSNHEIRFALPVETVAFPAWPENVTAGPGGTAELPAPEGAGYTLRQAWTDPYGEEGTVAQQLQDGKLYMLVYYAEPMAGYAFSADTAATVDGVAYETTLEGQVLVAYQIYDLGTKKVDRLELTLPTLYKGYTPGEVTAPAAADYSVVLTAWAESASGSFADAQFVEVPSYDTSIYALPMLLAKEGYSFAEALTLVCNGKEVTIEDMAAEGPLLEIAALWGTLTAPQYGWVQEDNTWAYYSAGEKLKNTWMLDSAGWCYLGSEGLMLKNAWASDSYGSCYVGADGYMVYSKWIHDGVGWAYINASGYCVFNAWQRDYYDWCYLGADGYMATNRWVRDYYGWCYVGADGYMVRNAWAADSFGVCRLDADGYMVTSRWIHDGNGWAYVDALGYALFGQWLQDGGYWYVLGDDGYMLADCWVEYYGYYYRLGSSGVMLTSTWIHDGNGWSYVNSSGIIPMESWVKDGGGTCYIGKDGYMLTNQWITIDGKKYYVDADGHRLENTTRTLSDSGYFSIPQTYKFDSNGVATLAIYY